jgi:hypothetical protein
MRMAIMRKTVKLLIVILSFGFFMPLYAQIAYKMSAASTIEISGTSTVADWIVKSEEVSGEMIFTVSKGSKENVMGGGTISDAKATLEVSSIKSEKGEPMDNKMYKALKNETYPEITFLLTNPLQLQKAPAKLSAAGNVQLAGVTRPMTFDLNLTYADNSFHVEGSRSLKLSDFEIEPPTAMFGQIVTGDEIVVKLNLFFVNREIRE